MGLLTRLFHREHPVNDPIDSPIPREPYLSPEERRIVGKMSDYDWVNSIRLSPRPRPDAEMHTEWRRLYESGQGLPAIGRAYNTNVGTIWRVLTKMGVTMRKRGRPPVQRAPKEPYVTPTGPANPERAAEILRLRTEEHLTYEEIGRKYGVSRERVRQILVEGGADMRGLVEARLDVVAKVRQPKPPSICKFCGEDFSGTQYAEHTKNSTKNHNPHADAAFYEERDRLVAADYAAGMKVRDIMAKYEGIPPSAVSRAIERNGVPRRRPGASFLKTKPEIDARKAAIVADLKDGMKQADVAAKHGVSAAWVSMVASRAGMDTRKFHRSTPGERDALVAAYASGEPMKSIRVRFGRTDSIIYACVKEAGIPLRRG